MGLFNRKKKETEQACENIIEELSKLPCERKGGKHLYRDFPPYITYEWHGSFEQSYITLTEPYVCVYCGKRIDKPLEKRTLTGSTYEEFSNTCKEFKKQYKDIAKPVGVVEDMVEDAIMLDRKKLMFWDQIHAPTPPEKEPFEFKLGDEQHEMDIGKMGRE